MSHDIRSPLLSIISVTQGYSGLSLEDSFKLVGSIANYLIEFVNCLLVSLQSEANGTSIKMFHEYFNTTAFLEEIKEMMSPLAWQQRTTISIEGNPKDMMVTDKSKLTQIVVNFIGNSIKFTKNGNIYIKHERLNKRQVRFIVQDTGVGMSEEAKKKLFIPFNSTGNMIFKNSQGIGLGKPPFGFKSLKEIQGWSSPNK
jgi:signal transduction histidine kinase